MKTKKGSSVSKRSSNKGSVKSVKSSKKFASSSFKHPPAIQYRWSDPSFIDKGYSLLPGEKNKKIITYASRPSKPSSIWLKERREVERRTYEDGSTFAEFHPNGRAKVFYPNGRLAILFKHNDKGYRVLVYQLGGRDNKGITRSHCLAALFDSLGNGVVYGYRGQVRINYTQRDGILRDTSNGLPVYWEWPSLIHIPEPEKEPQYFLTHEEMWKIYTARLDAEAKDTRPSTSDSRNARSSRSSKNVESEKSEKSVRSQTSKVQTKDSPSKQTIDEGEVPKKKKGKKNASPEKKARIKETDSTENSEFKKTCSENMKTKSKKSQTEEFERTKGDSKTEMETVSLEKKVSTRVSSGQKRSRKSSAKIESLVSMTKTAIYKNNAEWAAKLLARESHKEKLRTIQQKTPRRKRKCPLPIIVLRINEYLSFRLVDQANINLLFRHKNKQIRLELGVKLDPSEELQTDFVDANYFSTEKVPCAFELSNSESMKKIKTHLSFMRSCQPVPEERDYRKSCYRDIQRF